MATQSLYRRYRPRRFGELKGQDHVVRALRNAVAEGREGQAYLFSGPRGTGKTTSARILAKVLNCERPVDGEPCCECDSCLAVERGTSYDVHELDAASNNGVDAMRDLIEKASLGTPGRHKVYILDEVHMLSKAAEAALLKTLEEPPPHVVFVLATTDPQKMSDTIRSRTQHLQFHLLPADTLLEHARWVAEDAGLDVSDAAMVQVLQRGAGSARDTLSALELVATSGGDDADAVPLDRFVDAMIERDAGAALTATAEAIGHGSDPRMLAEELIGHLRNGFLALMAPDLVLLPSDRVAAIGEQARRLGPAGLVRGIEHLGAALAEMRHAPDPRVLLEVAIVQLTSDAASDDLTAILARLHRLEEQVAAGGARAARPPAGDVPPAAATDGAPVDPGTGRAVLGGRARRGEAATGAGTAPPPQPAGQPAAEPPTEPAAPPAAAPVDGPPAAPQSDPEPAPAATDTAASGALSRDAWESTVRPGLRGMARAVYAPAEFVASTADTLTLALPNPVHRDKCEQHRGAVEQAVSSATGRPVTVELTIGGGGKDGADAGPSPGGGDTAQAPSAGTPRPATPRSSASSTPSSASPPSAPREQEAPEAEAAVEPTPIPADDEVDLDDLVDAPPEAVKTPIDRLAEAFPGSELIDERT